MGLPLPERPKPPRLNDEVSLLLPWFYEIAPERDYSFGEFGAIPHNLKERHIRPFYRLLHAYKMMPYEEFLGLIRNMDRCWQKAKSLVDLEKAEKAPKNDGKGKNPPRAKRR